MSEETNLQTANATVEAPEIQAPADYREYVKWRQAGEQPLEETPPPAAAQTEEPAPAKTDPHSGAEEPEQEEETEEQPVEARSRPGSRQRKIDKLTRENEMLKQQLVEAAQQRTAPQAPAPAQPAPAEGKPRLQDFENLEAWQIALTRWVNAEDRKKAEAEAAQAAALTERQRLNAAWASSEEAARAVHPDYDEVLQSIAAPTGPGVPDAVAAMRQAENGGEILYYLGTHLDEMKRIAALQPVAAVMAIGRIAARLNPESSPVPNGKPKVSSAPKPPAPLSRTSGQATKDSIFDPNVMSDYTRWERARLAQLKDR